MEQVQSRIQEAVNTHIDDIERNYLRKMQMKMHQCSVQCCANETYKAEDVQRCCERCAEGPTQVQHYMQQELESFQNRLQRCAMDCQDQIRDKVGASPSEAQVMKYRGEMETCVVKCADTNLKLLPTIMNRIKDVVKQKQNS